MSSACLPYTVILNQAVGQADNTWMALAFVIGIIVGLIVGAIATYFILRYFMNKNKPDGEEELLDEAEDDMYDEVGSVNEYNASGMFFSVDTMAGGKKGKKKKKGQKKEPEEKQIHLEDFGIIPTSAIYSDEHDRSSGRRRLKKVPGSSGLLDALLKPNGESVDLELANQELDFITLLEKELRDGKVVNINQLIKMLLAHFTLNGALSPEFYKEFTDEVREAIIAILKQMQDEQQEEERKLEEDKNLKNDPAAMERAKEELHAKYALRMDSLLSQEQQNMKTKLVSRTDLSEDEVDDMMIKLEAGMTAFEEKTGDHLAQQKKTLEERMLRRKMISQMREQKQEEEAEQIGVSVDHYQDATERLVSDGLLAESQAKELMEQYTRTMGEVQHKYDEDNRRQMSQLAQKFQERRLQKIGGLETELKTETEQLLTAYDGKSEMTNYIKSYHRMKEEHQERLDNLVDELDQQEIAEITELKKAALSERKGGIKSADKTLIDDLRVKYRLPEDDVIALIDEHKTRMNQFEARKKQERKQLANDLSIKLADRMKSLEETQAEDAFQIALKDRQDQVIKEVLTVQPDLDEDARKKILLQHERNVRALDNQMAMSKMKQQQILESRRAQRKARIHQMEDQKARAEQEGQKKESQQLENRLAEETALFEEEETRAETELRQKLQREADKVLKAQELEMSKLIGRLQVGKARRQAILTQQDKTLQGLQDRMAKEGSVNVPEQILQQHYNDMAYIQQRIQKDRQNQEAHIKDQIEAKKYAKERELEAKLAEGRLRSGGIASSSAFTRLMADQQQKKYMDDMEREMKLELQKQKVEMDREFEKELQDSLNDLNTNLVMQLAAVSNMSKKDIENMVQDAVADTGGDQKKAKTLTRRLTMGMERAKTSLKAVAKLTGKGKRSLSKSTSQGSRNEAFSEEEDEEDETEDEENDSRQLESEDSNEKPVQRMW